MEYDNSIYNICTVKLLIMMNQKPFGGSYKGYNSAFLIVLKRKKKISIQEAIK
jgi:hypothetical protein